LGDAYEVGYGLEILACDDEYSPKVRYLTTTRQETDKEIGNRNTLS
jgi:hypothetical protein